MLTPHIHAIKAKTLRPPENSAEHCKQHSRLAGMGKITNPAVRPATRYHHHCQAPKQKASHPKGCEAFSLSSQDWQPKLPALKPN
jgi:hypothetical protein